MMEFRAVVITKVDSGNYTARKQLNIRCTYALRTYAYIHIIICTYAHINTQNK